MQQDMEAGAHQANPVIHRFWQRTNIAAKGGVATRGGSEWNEEVYYLSQYGRSGEEALRYLYSRRPSFDEFWNWLMLACASLPVNDDIIAGNVLSEEDHNFWDTNGYLVVKNVVSKRQCEDARNAIWEFLGAAPADVDSWYQLHAGKQGMMLDFFQHPALWVNRNATKIRKVYEELYGATPCYLLVDKVSFNAPETDCHRFNGSRLHWDVSLSQPIPFVLQGLLYLNDTSAEDGAFHCVPGFHKEIDNWLASLPAGADARKIAVEELKPIAIPGSAGDLVIWHQALPHCATPNRGTMPRMVQYIAYKPVNMQESTDWK